MNKYLKAFDDVVIGEYFPESKYPSLDILEEAVLKCDKIAVLEEKLGIEIMELFGLVGKDIWVKHCDYSVGKKTSEYHIVKGTVEEINFIGDNQAQIIYTYGTQKYDNFMWLKDLNKSWFLTSEEVEAKKGEKE